MKGKILIVLLSISFNSFSQKLNNDVIYSLNDLNQLDSFSKNIQDDFLKLIKRPNSYKLDTVMIDGKKYVGEILQNQQFIIIDLGNGEQIKGSIGSKSDREKNYIISDNRSTRIEKWEINRELLKNNRLEVIIIYDDRKPFDGQINPKMGDFGFYVLIDDGLKYNLLRGKDNSPVKFPTQLSVINVFETLGYSFLKSEMRPIKSTPLITNIFRNFIREVYTGINLNDFENTLVFQFIKN